MALNPMQRRARNSFMIGFLVSLIFMAIVVLLLLRKMKSLDEAKQALEALQSDQYVATEDITSGTVITNPDEFNDLFGREKVQTTMDTEGVISEDDLNFVDEDGNVVPKYNEDGVEIYHNLVFKCDINKGQIVTKDMFYYEDTPLDKTERVYEVSSVILPSHLKNGDYVDIRLSLPNGQDFIVISKKKVVGSTENILWLNLSEIEINLLNCAIVEAYSITGTKLYAIQYVDPGMQGKSTPTYVASEEVINLINYNPNIVDNAKQEYYVRINNFANYRAQYINGLLAENYDRRNALVESGLQDAYETIKGARKEFVESLEGSDDMGYNR